MTIRSRLRDLAATAYYKYLTPPEPNNLGERDVESSWFAAKLADILSSRDGEEGGLAIDVGGATSWLSLLLGRLGYTTTTVDLSLTDPLFFHARVLVLKGDFLTFANARDLSVAGWDLIASCSVIENMGLGRYGEALDPRADLRHMETCATLLKSGGLLLLSTQVGKHRVVPKLHKIYDAADMTRLLVDESVWRRTSTEYWAKLRGNTWEKVSIEEAYAVDGAYYNYALGLFELEKV